MKIEEGVPLSELTTFRIGGPAAFVVSIESDGDARAAHMFAKEKRLPLIPFGGGSNILGSDAGIDTVLVRSEMRSISVIEDGARVFVTADAGCLWDELVEHCVEHGRWGLENLSGIPGTVGGACVQNVGAYGAALSESLVQVEAYDTHTDAVVSFKNNGCAFAYRDSVFKHELDRYIVLRATFVLSIEPKQNLAYKDLKNIKDVSLAGIRNSVLEIRKQKFPPLSEAGCAGSYFHNPVLNSADALVLQKQFPDMPLFDLPEGGIKVPIAWVLDHVLHIQDLRIGRAFVWPKQVLVIAADFGATSVDVQALAKNISNLVYERTKIKIVPEVRFL